MTKVVCEIGLNHNGDFNRAIEMIRMAKECGAHVAKFQYFDVDVLCVQRNDFNNYNLLKKICPRPQWLPMLKKECDRAGIEFACTVFCKYSAQDVNPYVKSFKVASPEVLDIPFLKELAAYKKPLILSTGKATFDDLDRIFREVTDNIILLYCVSKYPAEVDDYSLNMIDKLKERYKVPVGISDHTRDIDFSIAAADKGVFMIEKHFKYDEDCVDAAVSLNPAQLTELTRAVRHLDRYK